MRKTRHTIIALLGAVALSGCATMLTSCGPPDRDRYALP
jgi:hypothetical protein